MNDQAFSLSFFCYFRVFTHYKLFVSFRSFRLQNKQNQPASSYYYFIKTTCNSKCHTQITMGVADYSKQQLKTVRFPI